MPDLSNLSNQELLRRITPQLRSVIHCHIDAEQDRERLIQIKRAQIADIYYRGFQYAIPVPGKGGTISYMPVQSASELKAFFQVEEDHDFLRYNLNIYRGDIDKFVAVISRMDPKVKARARTRYERNIYSRLRAADAVEEFFRSAWNDRDNLERICRYCSKYGPVYLHTAYVADGDRYGFTEEPVIEPVLEPSLLGFVCAACGEIGEWPPEGIFPACPNCGKALDEGDAVPGPPKLELRQNGVERLPNGSIEIEVCSVLTATTAHGVKDLSKAPWMKHESNEFIGTLRMLFPDYADQIKESYYGSASTAQQATAARDQTSSPTGTPGWWISRGKAVHTQYWLAPSMFYLLEESGGGLDPKAVREELLRRFPRGFRLHEISGVRDYVKIVAEAVNDVWTSVAPYADEGITAVEPYFSEYIEGQTLFNDIVSIQAEIAATAVPVDLFRTDILDPEFIHRFRQRVRQMIPVGGMHRDIKGSIVRLDPSEPNSSIINFMEFIHKKLRENRGITDALFGGGQYNTAREAVIAREQSLQMVQPFYIRVRDAYAEAKRKGAMLASRFSAGRLYHPMGLASEPQFVDISGLQDLQMGGWLYANDESQPTSPSDRREQIDKIISNPAAAQLLDMDHPENKKLLKEAAAMPDWYIRDYDMLQAVREEIYNIIRDPDYPMPEPDPALYIPEFAAEVIRAWLNSDEGRQIKSTDPDSFDRVKEWMQMFTDQIGSQPTVGGSQEKPASAVLGERPGPSGSETEPLAPEPVSVGSPGSPEDLGTEIRPDGEGLPPMTT